MFGVITINGVNYVEREVVFPKEVSITAGLQVLTNQSLVLPGVAPFLLKGLTRETAVAGVSSSKRFKFKFGNSDGSVWYTSGGTGGTTDRVVDTLIFGNAQFPFVLIPPIYYSKNASILFEVEDISNSTYTIYLAFHGSYLIKQ